MTVWLDAQLPPALAPWLAETFSIEANAVRDLGLLESTDETIFAAARKAAAIVMTKDRDFLRLLEQFGPPPRVIWITCGNTSVLSRIKCTYQSLTNGSQQGAARRQW